MFGFKDKKNTPAVGQEFEQGLILYHYASCPFCRRVRQHVQQHGWRIVEKDILQNSSWREELLAGGGKTQVPCLRIESADGAVQWLYESLDVVHYLNDRLS